MPYGTLKCDTITFTSSGVDKSVSISGLVQNPTFSGNITSTGTISGATIQGGTLVSGATVTGSVGQFTSVTGTTGNFGTLNASSIPGYAVLSGAQTFSGGQRGLVSVVAYATGIALDLSTSNNFQVTLSGNTTLQNPTNITSGQAGIVSIIQSTGSNTMAFGSYWHYPGGSGSVPTLTTTSGSTDVLAYYVVNTTKIAYRLVQDIKA